MAESILLEINSVAPVFNLVDIFGNRINLKNYLGKRVFLGFFRHAGCPFCNIRIHRLEKVADEMKARNLEMIFFFESTEKLLLSNKFHSTVNPTPLISDPEKVWYQQYGVENSVSKSVKSHITSIVQTVISAKLKGLPVHMMAGKESINTIPAEFLIDEWGIIKKVHYARHLNDQMSIDLISKFADGASKR